MNSDDITQLWIKSVGYSHSGSERTEFNYTYLLPQYCEFIGQSPEQIVQDYENAEQNKISERTIMRKHSQKIQLWIMNLEKKGHAPSSIRSYVGIVMSFYNYNDLSLGKIPMPKLRITYHNRDITKDEVNKIIAPSPLRERAFMAVMAQSGLRPCTITKLKIEDIEKILEKETPIPCMITVSNKIEKGKLGEGHPAFIGEESVKYIKQYLMTRKNLTPQSLLFATEKEKKLNEKNVSRTFRIQAKELNRTGNLDYKINISKPSELRLYNLRKFFRKYANQMGFEHVNYLMNHKTEGSDANYTPKDPEFYRELYKTKAMPFLRLETPTPTETAEILLTLKDQHEKELEAYKTENSQLKVKLSDQSNQLTDQQKQINEILRILGRMMQGQKFAVVPTDGEGKPIQDKFVIVPTENKTALKELLESTMSKEKKNPAANSQ
jgi:integrase